MTETKTIAKKVDEKQLALAAAAILDGTPLPGANSDPEVVSRAIVERILAAETFDQVFTPQNLEGWREYMGVAVFIRDVHFNPTSIENNASSVYAVVDIDLAGKGNKPSGDVRTVTCGGRNVLAQLLQIVKHGWYDKPYVLTGKRTGEGYTALWLEAA